MYSEKIFVSFESTYPSPLILDGCWHLDARYTSQGCQVSCCCSPCCSFKVDAITGLCLAHLKKRKQSSLIISSPGGARVLSCLCHCRFQAFSDQRSAVRCDHL